MVFIGRVFYYSTVHDELFMIWFVNFGSIHSTLIFTVCLVKLARSRLECPLISPVKLLGSATRRWHQHQKQTAPPSTPQRALPAGDEGDYRDTGRHTWATSSRALVEENLKEGSGGAREGARLEGGREKVLRGKRGALFEGLGTYTLEREPGERKPGAQGAAREE